LPSVADATQGYHPSRAACMLLVYTGKVDSASSLCRPSPVFSSLSTVGATFAKFVKNLQKIVC
jgi:hypothetical protein